MSHHEHGCTADEPRVHRHSQFNARTNCESVHYGQHANTHQVELRQGMKRP